LATAPDFLAAYLAQTQQKAASLSPGLSSTPLDRAPSTERKLVLFHT